MDNFNLVLRDIEDGSALRRYSYYRPTILVLLKEHKSHGYELANRVATLGFDPRAGATLYGVLREMENEELIASSWELSEHGGPPRRVYSLTPIGEEFLADSMPVLARQRQALGALLELYSMLDQKGGDATAAVGVKSTRRKADGLRRSAPVEMAAKKARTAGAKRDADAPKQSRETAQGATTGGPDDRASRRQRRARIDKLVATTMTGRRSALGQPGAASSPTPGMEARPTPDQVTRGAKRAIGGSVSNSGPRPSAVHG